MWHAWGIRDIRIAFCRKRKESACFEDMTVDIEVNVTETGPERCAGLI
jgi:hypothetical protein